MSNQGNGGIYSKFQERLRKIRLSRIKKKKQNDEFVEERVKEIREELNPVQPNLNVKINNGVLSQLDDSTSKVIQDIKSTANDRVYDKKSVSFTYEDNMDKNLNNNELGSDDLDEVIESIRENKPKFRKNKRVGYIYGENKDDLSNLGAEIIDKLKKCFEDKSDELEVMMSELYILSKQQESEVELNKVKEITEKVNELVDKINIIIEQYSLYKKNYYIDNVIGIDDNIIVDDIIRYRDLLDSFEDEKKFVKEYKALEEFKSLYNNLVDIKEETEKLQLENEEKIEEYQIRDKKYDDIRLGIISSIEIGKKCSQEIVKQNEYFSELMSKINDIESEEYVTTHLRGIGNLIGSSLRFMGLMLISPFTGMVPGISMQAIATRRLIANAYNQLHFENVRRIHYDAINYDSELNHHLNDVDYADNLISDTLKDVNKLKEDFMLIYNSNVPGYEDTLKKIDKIEEMLLSSQNKIFIVKNNLNKSKKLNDEKMARVRTLNDNQRLS